VRGERLDHIHDMVEFAAQLSDDATRRRLSALVETEGIRTQLIVSLERRAQCLDRVTCLAQFRAQHRHFFGLARRFLALPFDMARWRSAPLTAMHTIRLSSCDGDNPLVTSRNLRNQVSGGMYQ